MNKFVIDGVLNKNKNICIVYRDTNVIYEEVDPNNIRGRLTSLKKQLDINLLFAFGFKNRKEFKIFIRQNPVFMEYKRRTKIDVKKVALYYIDSTEELKNHDSSVRDLLREYTTFFSVKIIRRRRARRGRTNSRSLCMKDNCLKFFNISLLLLQYKLFYEAYFDIKGSRSKIYSSIMLVEKITSDIKKLKSRPLKLDIETYVNIKERVNTTAYFQCFTQGAITDPSKLGRDVVGNCQEIFFYDINSRYRYALKHSTFRGGEIEHRYKPPYNFMVLVNIQHCPKSLRRFKDEFGLDIDQVRDLSLEEVSVFKRKFPDLYAPYYCVFSKGAARRLIIKTPIAVFITVEERNYMAQHGYLVDILSGWNSTHVTDFGRHLVNEIEYIRHNKLRPVDRFKLKKATPKAIAKDIINMYVGNTAKSSYMGVDYRDLLTKSHMKMAFYQQAYKKVSTGDMIENLKLKNKMTNFFVFYKIVSFSRMRIHNKIVSLLRKGEHVYYSRTDSIVTTADLKDDQDFGPEIGQFKLEYPKLINFVVRSQNHYLVNYQDKTGKDMTVIKGMTTNKKTVRRIFASIKEDNPSRNWVKRNGRLFQDSVPVVYKNNEESILLSKEKVKPNYFYSFDLPYQKLYSFDFISRQIVIDDNPCFSVPSYFLKEIIIPKEFIRGFANMWQVYHLPLYYKMGCAVTLNYFWVRFSYTLVRYLQSDQRIISKILPGLTGLPLMWPANLENMEAVSWASKFPDRQWLKLPISTPEELKFYLQQHFKYVPTSYFEFSKLKFKRRYYLKLKQKILAD